MLRHAKFAGPVSCHMSGLTSLFALSDLVGLLKPTSTSSAASGMGGVEVPPPQAATVTRATNPMRIGTPGEMRGSTGQWHLRSIVSRGGCDRLRAPDGGRYNGP